MMQKQFCCFFALQCYVTWILGWENCVRGSSMRNPPSCAHLPIYGSYFLPWIHSSTLYLINPTFAICMFMSIERSTYYVHLCVSTGPCYEDRSKQDFGRNYGYRMRLILMVCVKKSKLLMFLPFFWKIQKNSPGPWSLRAAIRSPYRTCRKCSCRRRGRRSWYES